jgi:glycosyltransferase involved in cell wall biosynthesis
VFSQSFQQFEILVVDDASTDNTAEVVNEYQGLSSFSYLSQEQNRGAPTVRNIGAAKARGEYLAFLDSDDIWYPEFLEHQLSILKESSSDVGLVCCGMLQKGVGYGRIMSSGSRDLSYDENLQFGDGICTSSFLIKRAAFEAIGGFDVNFPSFQDFDFLLRMSKRFRIIANDRVLMEYWLGEDSISLNMKSKAKGYERIVSIYRDDITHLGVLHRYLFRIGQYYVISGSLTRGWRYWLRANRSKSLKMKVWIHFLLSLGGVKMYKFILSLHTKRIQSGLFKEAT